MPFERYLQDISPSDGSRSAPSPSSSSSLSNALFNNEDAVRAAMLGLSPPPVQFQLPRFLMNGPPTLAPGGGAEVMHPSAFMSPGGGMNNTWFNNNNADFGKFEQMFPLPGGAQFTSSDYLTENADPFTRRRSNSPPCNGNTFPTLEPVQMHAPPIPHPLGLPIYSASGFDLISILARVANRSNPSIALGPVDLTCAFVVADMRRHDTPIVYVSPSFCALTGYSEAECLGRNCRFLQAPGGSVQRGEARRYTSPEAVQSLRKAVSSGKETQVSMVNYRKNGRAFINLVSVVPVRAEDSDDIIYQIGFQVDLTLQPNAILSKLRDGSYLLNGSDASSIGLTARERKMSALEPNKMSAELSALLATLPSADTASPTSPTSPTSPVDPKEKDSDVAASPLHPLLLSHLPDFIHVLSLKGAFLYASPAITGVLGYEPEELMNRSLADIAHPADVIPLMRELKESSTPPQPPSGVASTNPSVLNVEGLMGAQHPRPVDLLFRARHKNGSYIWIEARGRLHVEPGKGRKAIILSGRARRVPSLPWSTLASAGVHVESSGQCWATVGGDGVILSATGWTESHEGDKQLVGRSVRSWVSRGREVAEDARRGAERGEVRRVSAEIDGKPVEIVFLPAFAAPSTPTNPPHPSTSTSADPILMHVTPFPSSLTSAPIPQARKPLTHRAEENVFSELEATRGSSWQYELQQLRFANQRMREEVERLSAATHMSVSPPPASPAHDGERRRNSVHGAEGAGGGWAMEVDALGDFRTGLKRGWEAIET